jgi:hypothetical protein
MQNAALDPIARLLLLVMMMIGCAPSQPATATSVRTVATQTPGLLPTRTATVKASATIVPSLTRTVTPTPAAIIRSTQETVAPSKPSATPTMSQPSATATHLPPTATNLNTVDCLQPPDDYRRVVVNGESLNARTLWMLERAAALYQGPGDLLRVTQGSYTQEEASSFGTHAGGGAVDISIRHPENPAQILWDETDEMVHALRRVGFAAWYRAPGDLGPGSPAHIHAIAIGDRELSPAAERQLDGPEGYLRGMNGIPPEYGGPDPDPWGGPLICPWMLELEYQNLGE